MGATGHNKSETTSSDGLSFSTPSGPFTPPNEMDDPSRNTKKKFSLDGYDQQAELNAVAQKDEILMDSPGTLPDSVYDTQMAWWRASVRRILVRSLKHESRILGAFQVSTTGSFNLHVLTPNRMQSGRHSWTNTSSTHLHWEHIRSL